MLKEMEEIMRETEEMIKKYDEMIAECKALKASKASNYDYDELYDEYDEKLK